ncbi:MAG: hypothetical protein ABIA63_07805, partial [bacterium]
TAHDQDANDSVLTYYFALIDSLNNDTLHSSNPQSCNTDFFALYDGNYRVIAKVVDAGGLSADTTYTVKVSGVNTNSISQGWNLAGFAGGSTPVSYFNLNNDSNFTAFTWDEDNLLSTEFSKYNQLFDSTILNRSRASWIYSSTGGPTETLSKTGIALMDTVHIQLDSGWNMVANPYTYAVDFHNILPSDSSTSLDTLYSFDDTAYSGIHYMEPWKGYWLHSDKHTAATILPKPLYPSRFAAKAKTMFFNGMDNWQVEITASCKGHTSQPLWLGVRPNAKAYMLQPPPPQGRDIRLFYEPSKDSHEKYRNNLKSKFGITEKWEMVIDNSGLGDETTMDFNGLQNIPGNLYVYLCDRGRYSDLRKTSKITLHTGGKKLYANFIVTEDPHFLMRQVKNFALNQNIPNPFNPITVIKYAIPNLWDKNGKEITSKLNVKLEIFNVKGQKIKDLIDAKKSPGYVYNVTWNGKTNTGRFAASGSYIYKIKIGAAFVKSRKMIMIK